MHAVIEATDRVFTLNEAARWLRAQNLTPWTRARLEVAIAKGILPAIRTSTNVVILTERALRAFSKPREDAC